MALTQKAEQLRLVTEKREAKPVAEFPLAAPPVGKLSVTVATKLDEEMARRYRQRALACGMTDAQLFRLLLERSDLLLQAWDERCNIRYYIDQFVVHIDQASLFFGALADKLRCKR